MAEIIAIANQKGGVGKTTSTLNLGAALKEMGYRVLLVDLDPQGGLTVAMGYTKPDDLERTAYNVFTQIEEAGKIESVSFYPILTNDEALHLLPGNIELSNTEWDLRRNPVGSDRVLKDALGLLQSEYDYILMDCPPFLGMLTTNALTAANRVVVPMQADYLALKGLSSLTRMIRQIQLRSNTSLSVGGIFLTMANTNLIHTKDVIETTRRQIGDQYHVYDTIIRLTVALKESPVVGQSIFAYDSDSIGAKDYLALTNEVVNG